MKHLEHWCSMRGYQDDKDNKVSDESVHEQYHGHTAQECRHIQTFKPPYDDCRFVSDSAEELSEHQCVGFMHVIAVQKAMRHHP